VEAGEGKGGGGEKEEAREADEQRARDEAERERVRRETEAEAEEARIAELIRKAREEERAATAAAAAAVEAKAEEEARVAEERRKAEEGERVQRVRREAEVAEMGVGGGECGEGKDGGDAPPSVLVVKDIIRRDKIDDETWVNLLREGKIDFATFKEHKSSTPRERKLAWQNSALIDMCNSPSALDMGQLNALIAAGSEIRHRSELNGTTAMYWASRHGHAAGVSALLAADPDPEHVQLQSYVGATCLHAASRCGHSCIVKILIQADPSGEHLDLKDDYGKTALAEAIAGKKFECAALLRAAGGTQ
jgi:hypothetical protein